MDFTGSVDELDNGGVSSVGTDVFSESLVVSESVVGLGNREDNLSLKVLSGLSEGGFSGNGSFVIVGEQEDSRVGLLEDLLDGLVIEREDGGELVGVNEGLEGFI